MILMLDRTDEAAKGNNTYEQLMKEFLGQENVIPYRNATPERPMYLLRHPEGDIIIRYYLDPTGHYYDLVEYRRFQQIARTFNFCWTLEPPESFFDKFIRRPSVALSIYSRRKYGQPKLTKPEELKGVRQAFSVPFHFRVTCSCFINEGDLWIKHRDFFSEIWQPPKDDRGQSTSYYLQKNFKRSKIPQKFIYDDLFSSIILRAEAWLVVRNLLPCLMVHGPNETTAIVENKFKHLVGLEFIEQEWRAFWSNAVMAACKKMEERKQPG